MKEYIGRFTGDTIKGSKYVKYSERIMRVYKDDVKLVIPFVMIYIWCG